MRSEIDTTTEGGRLVFTIFSAIAEFEREVIRERTRAGLDASRRGGPAAVQRSLRAPMTNRCLLARRRDNKPLVARVWRFDVTARQMARRRSLEPGAPLLRRLLRVLFVLLLLQSSAASAVDFARDAVAREAGGAQDQVAGISIERDGFERDNKACQPSTINVVAGVLQLRPNIKYRIWPQARPLHARSCDDPPATSCRDAIRRPPRN